MAPPRGRGRTGAGGTAGGAGGGRREDSVGELVIAEAVKKFTNMFGGTLGALIASRAPWLLDAAKQTLGTSDLKKALETLGVAAAVLTGNDIPREAIRGAFEGLATSVGDGSSAPADPDARKSWVAQKVDVALASLTGVIRPHGAEGPKLFPLIVAIGKIEDDDARRDIGHALSVIERGLPDDAAKAAFQEALRTTPIGIEHLVGIATLETPQMQRKMLQMLLTPPKSAEKKVLEGLHLVVDEGRKILHGPKGEALVNSVGNDAYRMEQTHQGLRSAVNFQPAPKPKGIGAWLKRLFWGWD